VDNNSDIHKRETQRRRALWRLAGHVPGYSAARELVEELDAIDQEELGDPSLETAILDVGEVLVQVPVETHASTISIVRLENIPQPWRSRFLAASIGSTRVAEGFYAHDWHKFVRGWRAEMMHLDQHRVAILRSTP